MLKRSNRYTDRLAGQLASAKQAPAKVEYLLEHCGTKVILTDHARQQIRKRHDFINGVQMKAYFRLIVEGLTDFEWKYDDQEIFVYSPRWARGVVLTGRRDFKGSSRDLAYVVMTMYPFGSSRPMKESTEVVYV